MPVPWALHSAQIHSNSVFQTHSLKQGLLLLSLLPGVLLGAGPNGEAEGNLVDEVSKVVNQVEGVVVHCTSQVSKEVAERVDGPASGDDQTHGAERRLHVFADLVSVAATLPASPMKISNRMKAHPA